MLAIRLGLVAVFASLSVPFSGSLHAQNSGGHRATILLDSGLQRAGQPNSISVQNNIASRPDANRARLLFQPQTGSDSNDPRVAPASFVIQDMPAQNLLLAPPHPQQYSGQLADDQFNPPDSEVSSRATIRTQEQPPVPMLKSGSTAPAVTSFPRPVPILSGNRPNSAVPPAVNASQSSDLSFHSQRQPNGAQPQPFMPGLPLQNQSPPPVNFELHRMSPPAVQTGSSQPITQPIVRPVVQPFPNEWNAQDQDGAFEIPNEWKSGKLQENCEICRPLFYMDLFAGFNEYDSGFGRSIITNSTSTAINFESGFDFGSRLGIYQGQNLRSDLEFSFQFSDVTTQHSLVIPGQQPQNTLLATTSGDLTTWTGLSNVYWDFTNFPSKRIKPYVGAGVGFLFANADFLTYEPTGPDPYLNTDSSLAFQVMVGGTCRVTSRLDFFGEYRYLDADAVVLSTETGVIATGFNAPASFTQPTQIDLSGDSFVFGMRMKF